MKNELKIAIYARVSTNKQEVQNQIDKLKEYTKLREWNLVDVYTDTAISGRKASRPRLDEMKQHIKLGKVNGVLVWKLDRIGRSLSDLIRLIDYFDNHHCQFISYSNSIDTSTAEGKLMFHILGAFAEFEADLISERTKLAYEVKKKRLKNIQQNVNWGRKAKVISKEELSLIDKRRREKISWRSIEQEINSNRGARSKVSYNTLRRAYQRLCRPENI